MKVTNEKEYVNYLVECIKHGPECKGIWIVDGKTGAKENLCGYLSGIDHEVVQDSSDWKKNKGISIDLIGGMTPDIAVNSKLSNQNRILIEVKWDAKLHYYPDESQLVRYFIYMIAATTRNHGKLPDLKRAVLLAAPQNWFSGKNLQAYEYFVEKFYDVGDRFGIKIGKIECDAIQV